MADENTERQSSARRKSAGRAQPARSAGGSVRRGTTAAANSGASKREVAEARMAETAKKKNKQADEERIVTVANILLEDDAEYMRNRRIWWGIMIACMVGFFATMIVSQLFMREGSNGGFSLPTTILFILSFVLIFAAYIWDWRMIRPARIAMENRVQSMTVKKQQEIVVRHESAEAEARAAKRAARKR